MNITIMFTVQYIVGKNILFTRCLAVNDGNGGVNNKTLKNG